MRADSRPLDPSPAHPTVLLPLLTRGQPSPRVVENAPEATSTAPAGADRTPQAASSSPGHPHPAGRHLRRGHSTWPGACHPGRGHSTPSGTAIPSPNAQDVPGRTEMSPHAQDVPSRDARVWGIRGIPSHWCSECADVQPRPPDPTQTLEGTRQGRRSRPRAENPRFAATTRRSGSSLRPWVPESGGFSPPAAHRSAWLTPIPAARHVRRGPPGAPGYGHRPAPAHCAGGP